MPIFLSDEELHALAGDASAVAARADAFIRDLRRQLDTVRAESDAASIAAEQSCTILEQKYSYLSADVSRLQSENVLLSAAAEARLAEVADVQSQKHQLHLQTIGKDGEIERLKLESAELQKSKRHLLELIENKDAEIRERNATIQSYLDKIVNLSENNTLKEARLHDAEAELARCRATCNRVTEEKELLEKHNTWLNEELTTKVNNIFELRKTHMDVEADLSSKISERERQLNESLSSLNWSKERINELELRVNTLEEDLRQSRDSASTNEERFTAELSTVTKLVELYKESSEEWSKKAGELEGVIKALETHLSQVENDYKEKLEKEISVNKDLEKEAADLRMKLEKCEIEIENTRKTSELSLLPPSSFSDGLNVERLSIGETGSLVANVLRAPIGISGTALAASLLRDGWSLAKMYEKYQEAADAARHEQWGRKHSEAILERVLHEIEAKADVILEERAEHERMVEAYTLMDQKLQESLLEHENFERTIRQLKSELKMRERDCTIAQKEINDLEKQVTVLLKECQDVQLRCGGATLIIANNSLNEAAADFCDPVDAERVISEHLVTFKDINGLVEQNVHLRRLVRTFSSEEEKRDAEIRDSFQTEMRKVTDEAEAKVEAVLKRSEEQAGMIESLHSSVAMYKRLYEEERKTRASIHAHSEPVSEDGKKELMVLFEGSQEVSTRAHEKLSERARTLEQDLSLLRSELLSVRSERDKMSLEANFSRERLDSFMKEFDHQRKEANAVSARNVELSHLIVDYQKRLRECSDSLLSSEEKSQKLLMEVSILKHEREILSRSEKRYSEEVCSLSERMHRLQSSLDTLQSAEEIRENARTAERRKHEEYLRKVETEWAEAKKELQEERDHVRALTLDREKAVESSARQVEEMRKELADAWRAVASAESRAAVAEVRCSELEAKISYFERRKVVNKDSSNEQLVLSTDEDNGELWRAKEELEKLKEEARANKGYMLQYKEIAHTNETALKQIESAHVEYKAEAEKLKTALEDEVQSLRNKVSELESICRLKAEEAASAIESKESHLSSAIAEMQSMKEAISEKLGQIEILEVQVSSLRENLEKEHNRWRTAQDNYERQVILQSETIQELTNTSKELSTLQLEIVKLREYSEAQKTENDLLKTTREKDISELQHEKSELDRKYCEINEQNKILHNRLESLHIRLAEKEYSSSGVSAQILNSQADNDLQNVINYLRRSKEIAETEISLLKQEKLRLQSQLENALKAAETTQASFHSQCENSRTLLFKDEEFKALQLQVREISLLRESNVQLRAESKHNFEECQKLREEAHTVKIEAENLGKLLREKQTEFDACQKQVEMQKLEIGHLNNRIAELRESYKGIDTEGYERLKDELLHIKSLLKENELEVQVSKNLVSDKEERISNVEQDLAKCQSEIAELEKKLNDALQAEVSIKAENDRLKKMISMYKKKIENLTKEKEEVNYKNQALMKQIEDSKSSRKTALEISSEHAKKEQEKDTRIQILEKTLEREREDLKKEKEDSRLRRYKSQQTVMELIQKIKAEKDKVEEELTKHRQIVAIISERSGMAASQLPPGKILDERTLAYFQSIGNFEEFANSIQNDSDGAQSLAADSPIVDSYFTASAGRQIPIPQTRSPHVKVIEERERGLLSKPSSEVRKGGRRLVRPRLERPLEPSIDLEVSGTHGSTAMEEGKTGSSHDLELSTDAPSARKRLSSSVSELKEDPVGQDEAATNVAPSLKKSKPSEPLQEASSEEQSTLPSSETPLPQSMIPSDISESQPDPNEDLDVDQAPALTSDDKVTATKDEEEMVLVKEEVEEQHRELQGGTGQEDEVLYEADAGIDELDKPSTAMELLDENPQTEEVQEKLQAAAESEDEREEGELMPDDDLEQQQEDGVSLEGQNESISVGDDVGDETGDISIEVASPEVQVDKNEEISTPEVAEASDKHNDVSSDQGTLDSAQSPQRLAGAHEESAVPQQSSVAQPRSPSPSPSSSTVVIETDEPAPPRVISIAERAKQNSLLRMGRTTPAAARGGRGRSLGGGRRGTRGGRGGRGQSFSDREQ
ncbi:nuclear-pore anchor [Iris pallida]|uniref:Nuclear-pore anchor n=1 Tax=Iris pallida TaxID=29817 RepID=A0AAX6FN21_IRIPA|nr:nuclear-pore anchor [Iris pallida]